MVDEEGKPLVVYHATDAEFTVFDRDKLGERTKQRDIEDFNMDMEDSVGLLRSAELGFWFSEKNLAEDEYGGRHVLKLEDGKRIGMPVYLSIENPNYVDTYDLMETLDNMTVEEYLQEMEDYGYDGLIVTDQEFDNATSYVVFKPNQIKSATDNVGTFANIRYFVSLCRNGLSAAPKHPSLRYFCPVPTQATAEQSGDRQRRGKGSPILMAEKGEHERVPRAGESYPTPLRATLRAPPSKWAVEAFFP